MGKRVIWRCRKAERQRIDGRQFLAVAQHVTVAPDGGDLGGATIDDAAERLGNHSRGPFALSIAVRTFDSIQTDPVNR